MEVKKDMLIGELIRKKPEAIEILMQFGMGCVGCPSAQMETLEEAAQVHGMDIDKMIDTLNQMQ